jgi:hypothetical protein
VTLRHVTLRRTAIITMVASLGDIAMAMAVATQA